MSAIVVAEDNINALYKSLLRSIHVMGKTVLSVKDSLSPTTQFGKVESDTREIMESTAILTNPRARLLTNPIRPLDPFFAVGQLVWYIRGSNNLDEIAYYNQRGNDFGEQTGRITGNAYGYRMQHLPDGRNQLHAVVERLKKDPTSRRTFMPIYLPSDNLYNTKEVPCPIGVSFLIREGQLHCFLKMRSSNVVTLFPYNIFAFTMIQEHVALELGIELGNFYMNSISFHYLEHHYKTVVSIIENPSGDTAIMEPIVPTSITKILPYEAKLREVDDKELAKYMDVPEVEGVWKDLLTVLKYYATSKLGLKVGSNSSLSSAWKYLVEKRLT